MTLLQKKRLILLAIGVVVLAIMADLYISKRQEDVMDERRAKRIRLEKLAFRMISVDVRDIREMKDVLSSETYEALLRVDNVADEPVYITPPQVRTFIQTGEISWMEVQVRDAVVEEKRQLMPKMEVDRVEGNGALLYKRYLTISRDLPYNPNLMPKYMHVRFYITMFVLPESRFKEEEVVKRSSSVFVYLKPYHVSEEEIARLIDFGDTKVPSYMPITGFRKWNKGSGE